MEKMQILLVNKESFRLIIQEQEKEKERQTKKNNPASAEKSDISTSEDNGGDDDEGSRMRSKSHSGKLREKPISEMESSEESDSDKEDDSSYEGIDSLYFLSRRRVQLTIILISNINFMNLRPKGILFQRRSRKGQKTLILC